MQKDFDKVVANKDKEISHLKNHSQSLIPQIKKLKSGKKSEQEKVEVLTSKKSTIDKETMKIQNFCQILSKGINIEPIGIKNKK